MYYLFKLQGNSTYNIVFEGVRGTSYRGDIGLDDITLTDGTCGGTFHSLFQNLSWIEAKSKYNLSLNFLKKIKNL